MAADAKEDVDGHEPEDGEGDDLEDEADHHGVIAGADAGGGTAGCHYCSCTVVVLAVLVSEETALEQDQEGVRCTGTRSWGLPLDENTSNVAANEDTCVPLWCDARELGSVDNDTDTR